MYWNDSYSCLAVILVGDVCFVSHGNDLDCSCCKLEEVEYVDIHVRKESICLDRRGLK